MKEVELALEMEKITSKSSYMDFIRIPSFRKRLFYVCFLTVMMQLSGNGLVSYYLNKVLDSIGITNETKKLQINGCLMIYNFVCSAVFAYFTTLFKRRTLFISSTALMATTFIIWTVLSAINQERNFKQKSLANGVLAMIFLFNLSYNLGMNGLPFLYVTEVLPYSHRAKGMNIFSVLLQLILIYNGFVNPIAMDAIEWKYYIVYCCILVVEVVVVLLTFVETSGYTLEEVAKVFGDDPDTIIPQLLSAGKLTKVDHVEYV